MKKWQIHPVLKRNKSLETDIMTNFSNSNFYMTLEWNFEYIVVVEVVVVLANTYCFGIGSHRSYFWGCVSSFQWPGLVLFSGDLLWGALDKTKDINSILLGGSQGSLSNSLNSQTELSFGQYREQKRGNRVDSGNVLREEGKGKVRNSEMEA